MKHEKKLVLLVVALCAACKGSGPSAEGGPTGSASAAPSAEGSAAGSGKGAAGTASAEPGVDAALVGTWEGSYESKRASVTRPDKVDDKARDKGDDGSVGIGAGKVSLTISKAGDVTGTWDGALGKETLNGRVEVDGGKTSVRVRAVPDDFSKEDAMTGILVGELKGAVIQAEIHVAGRDALVVREASVDLKRK